MRGMLAACEINDRGPYRLLLDTGASYSVVDDGLAEEMGSFRRRGSKRMRGGLGRVVVAMAGGAVGEAACRGGQRVAIRAWVFGLLP